MSAVRDQQGLRSQVHGRTGSMRYQIEFVGGEAHDVDVSVSGPMSVEGTCECMAELIGDPRWDPGMNVLVDGTQLTPGGLAGSGVRTVAQTMVGDDIAWGDGFTAVVVVDPAVYGLMRMWHAATDQMQRTTDVFYSRTEALDWLSAA